MESAIPVVTWPGMVLCVRTNGLAGEMIRFGEMLIGEDDLENHVAVLDHKDSTGRWWAIEGRPGGVGWRDATPYLSSPWTLSNQSQAITDTMRMDICKTMRGLLGVPYDWTAISEDALRDLHLPSVWAENWHGVAPAHVVCSSAAAYAYRHNNLQSPAQTDTAHIQPADWADFIVLNGYQFPPKVATGPATPADGVPSAPSV